MNKSLADYLKPRYCDINAIATRVCRKLKSFTSKLSSCHKVVNKHHDAMHGSRTHAQKGVQ